MQAAFTTFNLINFSPSLLSRPRANFTARLEVLALGFKSGTLRPAALLDKRLIRDTYTTDSSVKGTLGSSGCVPGLGFPPYGFQGGAVT